MGFSGVIEFRFLDSRCLLLASIGRGDETVGSPHRAQIVQFELFELKFLNSSFSSLASC